MRPALGAVVLAAVVAAADAGAVEDRGIPTRDCPSRIESGRGPLAFDRVKALVVGPLAFTGLDATKPAALGRVGNGHLGRKSAILVRAGHPVVVSVPERYRRRLFLNYTRGTERLGLGGTSQARLIPCAPATRAFSYDGRVGRVTGFSGGFTVTRPGCYPLDVRVEGGHTYRARLALGYPCR
jgi:hypothetical protein